MADTAVPTIGEIVTKLGGTPSAETIVPALEELNAVFGDEGIDSAVRAYLDETGAQVGYSVDGNGDLSVTLT